jgi:uncharacterized membrane protein
VFELSSLEQGAFMTSYLLDWVGMLTRWLHIIAGIAWIGSSFYFVWLDNSLEPLKHPGRDEEGVAGEVWAVHGGGFYRSLKYRVAPGTLPATLHWFYWEAYTTWLSGFLLLCLLYLLRAEAYLVDPAIMPLSKGAAIGIALGTLVVTWLIYDALCRSPLGRHSRSLAATIGVLLAILAWGLCQIFSGRGAFMMFGAVLGTIMVANVLFVIIPGQRELVRAKQQGREVDPAPGLKGKQRSLHNTYFTLPVLLVMISNHYAMTYGARNNWLVLIALSFAGACIRAWFVARQKPGHGGGLSLLPIVLAALALVGVIFALSPAFGQTAAQGNTLPPAVELARVRTIFDERCVPCHAKNPTIPGFVAPPNGIMLQNVGQIMAHLPEVTQQLKLRTMPLGNLTNMTDEERETLLMWIGHGGLQ